MNPNARRTQKEKQEFGWQRYVFLPLQMSRHKLPVALSKDLRSNTMGDPNHLQSCGPSFFDMVVNKPRQNDDGTYLFKYELMWFFAWVFEYS